MASGTVGYTDTRGNKDYTSIIANQIGRRIKEASDMASDERAFASQQAEKGGTSLEEAGIGKGYFFGRALGSRFGGDRIARTRGRMGANTPGTNPTSNYKQRFRGGFDYKVTNNIQSVTDTAPVSAAVEAGLRGVQTGLVQVSNAITRQDQSLRSIANTQADMAKAIMFNGYLFQMFMSNQKARSGRSGFAREEGSIEGRRGGGYGGGGGGFGFGGGGGGGGRGGRGMINITPGGGTVGYSGPGGFGGGDASPVRGLLSAAGSLTYGGAGNSLFRRIQGTFDPAAAGTGLRRSDVLRGMTSTATGAYDPNVVGKQLAKFLGDPTSSADLYTRMMKQGSTVGNVVEEVGGGFASLVNKGVLSPEVAARMELGFKANAMGKSELYDEMIDAMYRSNRFKMYSSQLDALERSGTLSFEALDQADMLHGKLKQSYMDKDVFSLLTDSKGKRLYSREQVAIFQDLGLSPGEANIDRFLRRQSRGINPFSKMRSAGSSPAGIAEAIAKYYPNVKFKNIEEAVALTQLARYLDDGVKPKQAVRLVRQLMGNEIADAALVQGGKTAMKNPMVEKALKKAGGLRALKRLPVLGLLMGTFFAGQRLFEGDFQGAIMEFASGLLGMSPKTTGLGYMIDSYLLARDFGMMPMRSGGTIYPSKQNEVMSVGSKMFSFNEPGNKEVVRVEKDTDERFVDMGIGLVEGFKKSRNTYTKLIGEGNRKGFQDLEDGGFFARIFDSSNFSLPNIPNPMSYMPDWVNPFNWGQNNNTGNVANNNSQSNSIMLASFKPSTNMANSASNWFMKGYNPAEDTMSWKDLMIDDWKQRGKFGKAGKLGGWDFTRGFRPGVSAEEGGFGSGPTPAGRQAVRRAFGFLSSVRGSGLATLASIVANEFINPQALADGTMDGYLSKLNQNESMKLQNVGTDTVTTNPTIINNYYNGSGSGTGVAESGDETLGQGFSMDLDKFITSYSIASK